MCDGGADGRRRRGAGGGEGDGRRERVGDGALEGGLPVDVGGVAGDDERQGYGFGVVVMMMVAMVRRGLAMMVVRAVVVVAGMRVAMVRRVSDPIGPDVDVPAMPIGMDVRHEWGARDRDPEREAHHHQGGEAEQVAPSRHGRVAHSTGAGRRSTWRTSVLRPGAGGRMSPGDEAIGSFRSS